MNDTEVNNDKNEISDDKLDEVTGGTSTNGLERPKPPAAPGTKSGM